MWLSSVFCVRVLTISVSVAGYVFCVRALSSCVTVVRVVNGGELSSGKLFGGELSSGELFGGELSVLRENRPCLSCRPEKVLASFAPSSLSFPVFLSCLRPYFSLSSSLLLSLLFFICSLFISFLLSLLPSFSFSLLLSPLIFSFSPSLLLSPPPPLSPSLLHSLLISSSLSPSFLLSLLPFVRASVTFYVIARVVAAGAPSDVVTSDAVSSARLNCPPVRLACRPDFAGF